MAILQLNWLTLREINYLQTKPFCYEVDSILRKPNCHWTNHNLSIGLPYWNLLHQMFIHTYCQGADLSSCVFFLFQFFFFVIWLMANHYIPSFTVFIFYSVSYPSDMTLIKLHLLLTSPSKYHTDISPYKQ